MVGRHGRRGDRPARLPGRVRHRRDRVVPPQGHPLVVPSDPGTGTAGPTVRRTTRPGRRLPSRREPDRRPRPAPGWRPGRRARRGAARHPRDGRRRGARGARPPSVHDPSAPHTSQITVTPSEAARSRSASVVGSVGEVTTATAGRRSRPATSAAATAKPCTGNAGTTIDPAARATRPRPSQSPAGPGSARISSSGSRTAARSARARAGWSGSASEPRPPAHDSSQPVDELAAAPPGQVIGLGLALGPVVGHEAEMPRLDLEDLRVGGHHPDRLGGVESGDNDQLGALETGQGAVGELEPDHTSPGRVVESQRTRRPEGRDDPRPGVAGRLGHTREPGRRAPHRGPRRSRCRVRPGSVRASPAGRRRDRRRVAPGRPGPARRDRSRCPVRGRRGRDPPSSPRPRPAAPPVRGRVGRGPPPPAGTTAGCGDPGAVRVPAGASARRPDARRRRPTGRRARPRARRSRRCPPEPATRGPEPGRRG